MATGPTPKDATQKVHRVISVTPGLLIYHDMPEKDKDGRPRKRTLVQFVSSYGTVTDEDLAILRREPEYGAEFMAASELNALSTSSKPEDVARADAFIERCEDKRKNLGIKPYEIGRRTFG